MHTPRAPKNNMKKLTIVIPAKNEANSLRTLLPEIISKFPSAEIIVIDDGSDDDTAKVVQTSGVRLISHPYSMGNGAAVKSGARASTSDAILFMDADGQHNPDDIRALISRYEEGFDMVIGAREFKSQASFFRWVANVFYNTLASFMTGFKISDLTSGFRIVNTKKFRRFLYLLPNGFSYPTTSTMAFFRSGYSVAYIPIIALKREGKSKIKLLNDGIRFMVIILKIGALFSPMRLFLPISISLFLVGASYYIYTFATAGRFTNMSALLFVSSLMIFLIGIVSEQVSSLHYRDSSDFDDSNG